MHVFFGLIHFMTLVRRGLVETEEVLTICLIIVAKVIIYTLIALLNYIWEDINKKVKVFTKVGVRSTNKNADFIFISDDIFSAFSIM